MSESLLAHPCNPLMVITQSFQIALLQTSIEAQRPQRALYSTGLSGQQIQLSQAFVEPTKTEKHTTASDSQINSGGLKCT